MTDVSPNLELVVVEGLQRGSRYALHQGLPTTVGIRLDCDVVLEPQALLGVDNTILAGQEPVLRLTCEGSDVWLEVESGDVFMDQQRVSAGLSSKLLPDSQIRVGNCVFTLLPVDGLGSDTDVEFSRSTAHQSFMNADTGDLAQNVSLQNRGSSLSRLVLFSCAILGVVFVVAGIAEYIASDDHETVSTTELPVIAELLPAEGFEQLVVEQSSDNVAFISGFIAHRSRFTELTALISPYAHQVTLDITVGEEIQESVESVYRLHGVQAVVEVETAGNVFVQTAVSDDGLLDSIEERVQQDIAGVLQLERKNTPPEVIGDKPPADPIPGKRIVLVVASEPAYILTEDGSRYFPGSVLPNGYRILAIQNQKVDLVRNDEHLELIF